MAWSTIASQYPINISRWKQSCICNFLFVAFTLMIGFDRNQQSLRTAFTRTGKKFHQSAIPRKNRKEKHICFQIQIFSVKCGNDVKNAAKLTFLRLAVNALTSLVLNNCNTRNPCFIWRYQEKKSERDEYWMQKVKNMPSYFSAWFLNIHVQSKYCDDSGRAASFALTKG